MRSEWPRQLPKVFTLVSRERSGMPGFWLLVCVHTHTTPLQNPIHKHILFFTNSLSYFISEHSLISFYVPSTVLETESTLRCWEPLIHIPEKQPVAVTRASSSGLSGTIPQIFHHPRPFPGWLGPVPLQEQRLSWTGGTLCQNITMTHCHRSTDRGHHF